MLNSGGPALRFERALDASGRESAMPVIVNLFGTVARVSAGLGVRRERLGELGQALAALRAPRPLNGVRDALRRWPLLRTALATRDQPAPPPVPAFYLRPCGLEDIVDQIARRAVDLIRITPPAAKAWRD